MKTREEGWQKSKRKRMITITNIHVKTLEATRAQVEKAWSLERGEKKKGKSPQGVAPQPLHTD